jgi:hypothetical protein
LQTVRDFSGETWCIFIADLFAAFLYFVYCATLFACHRKPLVGVPPVFRCVFFFYYAFSWHLESVDAQPPVESAAVWYEKEIIYVLLFLSSG